MKRVYRVTVIVEREFERKATGEAKFIRLKLKQEAASRGWTVAKASISNRAQQAAPKPHVPTDAEVELQIAKGQILAGLREIASDMAAILGNVKKPRIEWGDVSDCGYRFHHNDAHAHIANERWVTGPRAGKRIRKGLICLNPRYALTVGWLGNREMWPDLVAHELMHIRMPGGSHKRAAFRVNVEALLTKYRAMKRDIELQERSGWFGEPIESPEPKSVLDIDDGTGGDS